MRQIDLRPYLFKFRGPEGEQQQEYRVRESLAELCFVPVQKVVGSELLKRSKLAEKIETWKDETLLLEEEEWQRLVKAVESGELNLGRNEVEAVRRIIEAPVVEVKPA